MSLAIALQLIGLARDLIQASEKAKERADAIQKGQMSDAEAQKHLDKTKAEVKAIHDKHNTSP